MSARVFSFFSFLPIIRNQKADRLGLGEEEKKKREERRIRKVFEGRIIKIGKDAV